VEGDGFRNLLRAADEGSRGSSSPRSLVIMVTVDEIRAVALALPRTTEGYRWALVGLAAIDADEIDAPTPR
jgi:hypothetical protein